LWEKLRTSFCKRQRGDYDVPDLKASLVHANESSVPVNYPFHIVLDSEVGDRAITARAQLPIPGAVKIARLRIAR
jgi:hypothetical protein